MVATVKLHITHRTLPAYRHSILVTENYWITTQTPFYYLDLADPNKIMFNDHFKKVFPENKVKTGQLSTRKICRKQRFYLDDISVACGGKSDSNLFYLYATSTDTKVDKLGMVLFYDFLKILNRTPQYLTSGESALRFFNFSTLIGYEKWKGITLLPLPGAPQSNLFVNEVFVKIYPSIIKGLYAKKSDLLVKRLWDQFCVTDAIRLHLFLKIPDSKHLKYMLDVANVMNFDFWTFRYGAKGFNQYVIKEYMKENRCDLATLLIDYGFSLGDLHPAGMERWTSEKFPHNGFMVWFLAKCYEENIRDLNDIPGLMELYQKISRSLPLPSLPPSLVRTYLQTLYEEHPFAPVEVEEMTAFYEACYIHTSDISVVAPQNLSHLCRTALRERLALNCALPAAIDCSHLPTLIKSFLRLEF